jgi:nitrogen regulatory protein P-II 1
MKKIEAIIRPTQFDDVRDALAKIGLIGLNTSELRGFGRRKGHTEVYRGVEHLVESHPYVKIELVVEDNYLQDAITTIMQAARTGALGDGKIFVSTLDQVLSIRTGEASITDAI